MTVEFAGEFAVGLAAGLLVGLPLGAETGVGVDSVPAGAVLLPSP